MNGNVTRKINRPVINRWRFLPRGSIIKIIGINEPYIIRGCWKFDKYLINKLNHDDRGVICKWEHIRIINNTPRDVWEQARIKKANDFREYIHNILNN